MRILALSGGGSGGLATAMYLHHLELRVGMPLYKKFDLVAGVSTGSIIASAIAGGMPMVDLVAAYEREIPVIFKKNPWKFWAGYLGCSRYSKEPLRAALKRLIPIQSLGEAKTGLMLYANQIAPITKTKFWKSWKPEDAALSVMSCVAASCSAPTYFDPEEYLGSVYIDGGLSTNDPGAPAVAEAIRRSMMPAVCLDIQVSHAAGISVDKAKKKTSAVAWLSTIFSDTLSFGQDVSAYIAEAVLSPPNYLKVNLGSSDPLDAHGDEFAKRCKARADELWRLSEDGVDDLLARG